MVIAFKTYQTNTDSNLLLYLYRKANEKTLKVNFKGDNNSGGHITNHIRLPNKLSTNYKHIQQLLTIKN